MKDVLIKNYYSLEEAEFAKQILKEKGIESVVQAGMTLSGGLNSPLPEHKLFVLEKDVNRAIKILKEKEKPIKEKYIPVRKRLDMKGGIILLIIFFLLLYFIPKIIDFLKKIP